jgi:hypothetical protein
MPVLRFGLDAANTFFQYTLMKVAFMKYKHCVLPEHVHIC